MQCTVIHILTVKNWGPPQIVVKKMLGIINGDETIDLSDTDTFVGTFGKRLPFSVLYDFVKERKQFIFNRNIPQASCLCEICEKVCLMAKGINKSCKQSIPTNPHDIVERYSCNSTSKTCRMGDCTDSSNFELDVNIDESSSDSEDGESGITVISYYIWGTGNKRGQKVLQTIDRMEASDNWIESVKSLKQHIHRKRVQVSSLNTIKAELGEDEILMQVDYSQSYKNAEQDEIQSAYFGHSCFSLFTACVYYREDEELHKLPITITTESSEHSRITSFSCLDEIVSHVEQKLARLLLPVPVQICFLSFFKFPTIQRTRVAL